MTIIRVDQIMSSCRLNESALILSLRRLNKPIYKFPRQDWNWKIWPFIISVPLFHAVLMYIPQTQYALSAIGIRFEIIQLVPIDWLIVLALGFSPIALLELTKILIAKREQARMKFSLPLQTKV